MRIESIVASIDAKRRSLQEGVFSQSPADMAAFERVKGRWIGLGDALAIISEEVRKVGEDD